MSALPKAKNDPTSMHLVYCRGLKGIEAILVYSDYQLTVSRKNRRVVQDFPIPADESVLFIDTLREKYPCTVTITD